MPYQVNRNTYGWSENLAILPPKHVTLRHKTLQDMYRRELANRDRYNSPMNILDNLNTRVYENWCFFVGPVLTAPFLLILWVFRDRRTRPLIVFLSLVAFLNLFQLVL